MKLKSRALPAAAFAALLTAAACDSPVEAPHGVAVAAPAQVAAAERTPDSAQRLPFAGTVEYSFEFDSPVPGAAVERVAERWKGELERQGVTLQHSLASSGASRVRLAWTQQEAAAEDWQAEVLEGLLAELQPLQRR